MQPWKVLKLWRRVGVRMFVMCIVHSCHGDYQLKSWPIFNLIIPHWESSSKILTDSKGWHCQPTTADPYIQDDWKRAEHWAKVPQIIVPDFWAVRLADSYFHNMFYWQRLQPNGLWSVRPYKQVSTRLASWLYIGYDMVSCIFMRFPCSLNELVQQYQQCSSTFPAPFITTKILQLCHLVVRVGALIQPQKKGNIASGVQCAE